MINHFRNKKYFFYSFFLPIIIMLISYFLLNIYPFGDNILLTSDMRNQYVSFFSYFKNALLGNDSLFYSFSKTMGGEMVGLVSYYLLSPFNLLFIFSNTNNLPIIIMIITLLKIGSSGLTMFMLLNKEINQKQSLIFALIYSMIAYNNVYQHNIMWLDGVILLPLIVLGINYLMIDTKKYIYIITLSLAIITNYYIGFMLSIFAVIYFIAKMTESLFSNRTEFHKCYKNNILIFLISSLLAGGISAITIIPTVFSLSGGKAEFDPNILSTTSNFKMIDFVSKNFIGAYSRNQMIAGLPNVYTSVLVLILVTGYFTTKHIELSKKIISLGVILSMLFSFKISGLNVVWHGFNFPAWFPYRYSFIFSFYLIYLASINAKHFYTDENKNIRIKFFMIFLIFSVIVEKINYEYLSDNKITLTILFVAIYLLLFSKEIKLSRNKRYVLILLVCSLEIITNNYLILKNNSYHTMTSYQEYVDQNLPVIDLINEKDEEFYRIEKTFYFNQNDALLFNHPGLTHFSSSEKTNIKDFLGNIGYRNNGSWVSFSGGSSIASDSFMNVKYILSRELNLPYYHFLYAENGVNIYENTNVLPLGFLVDETIKENINYINPIQYINDIYSKIGINESIFTKISEKDIKLRTYNVEESTDADVITYSKKNKNEEAFIEYLIPVIDDNLITFYFLTDSLDGATLYVNDEYTRNIFNTYSHNINIAYSEDDLVKIKIVLDDEKLSYKESLFYYQDLNLFESTTDYIRGHGLTEIKAQGNRVSGSFYSSNNNDYLFLNIPYDDSWEITIDGVPKNAEQVFNNQMAIKTTEGTHILEMKYIPKGFKLGSIISFVSIFALVVISFKPFLKNNK